MSPYAVAEWLNYSLRFFDRGIFPRLYVLATAKDNGVVSIHCALGQKRTTRHVYPLARGHVLLAMRYELLRRIRFDLRAPLTQTLWGVQQYRYGISVISSGSSVVSSVVAGHVLSGRSTNIYRETLGPPVLADDEAFELAKHELDEYILVNNVRVFDPHVSDYERLEYLRSLG